MEDVLTIGGIEIRPGERKLVELEVARLFDFTQMSIPVQVIRGKEPGPVLFLSAAIHGDELNGIEIIKRIMASGLLHKLSGSIIAVPIVNIFGFNAKSRYLPDHRDLNRSFPGSEAGSLASRIAHMFMHEIVAKCTHGIDFHTGGLHRTNLPQIRAELKNRQNRNLARAFGAPIVINSTLRDGSLRQAVNDLGIPVLLYEGGEALRFNKQAITIGVKGTINVMKNLGMLPPAKGEAVKKTKPLLAKSSFWVRASHSGILTTEKFPGALVQKGEVLGHISDPLGRKQFLLTSPKSGMIIGVTTLPLVNRGDAAFHIAMFKDPHIHSDSIDLLDTFPQEGLL